MAYLHFLRRIFSVTYLLRHPAVPTRLKVLPLLAFIYLIFPRDLIIDLRPLGLIDDVLVVSLLLGIFINKAWKYVDADEQRKNDSIDADFKVLIEEERHKTGDGRRTATRPSTPPPSGSTPREDLRSR